MRKIIFSKEHKSMIEQLKKARIDKGLSQVEVVKILGKTQSYLSKIEAGQCRIDIVSLKEFAKIYNKDLGYFLK
ncbi:MAG: transcriptional regulator [Parcubacteria group bacterium GW2011_GWF2_38_76]|nr:MAG: transcriptional regulator [Parcubacteria group bacterium GW2011_GWF2_38_76]HBM46137.1 hypothetical protein [Patescibacteria group bacterium]